MNFGTWEAIARRQAWYVIALEQRLSEWSKERVDACTDLETMKYVLALAKRLDRHEQLMIRHLSKRVALAPDSGHAADGFRSKDFPRGQRYRRGHESKCQESFRRQARELNDSTNFSIATKFIPITTPWMLK